MSLYHHSQLLEVRLHSPMLLPNILTNPKGRSQTLRLTTVLSASGHLSYWVQGNMDTKEEPLHSGNQHFICLFKTQTNKKTKKHHQTKNETYGGMYASLNHAEVVEFITFLVHCRHLRFCIRTAGVQHACICRI